MSLYIPPIQEVYPNKWRLAECMSERSHIVKEVLDEVSNSRFAAIFKECVPEGVQFSVEVQNEVQQAFKTNLSKNLKNMLAYEIYFSAIDGVVEEANATALTENLSEKGKILKIKDRGVIQKIFKLHEIEIKNRILQIINSKESFLKQNIIIALKEIESTSTGCQ
ncbi:MAG: hypothetical protein H0X29_02230 [Parachlamydiaceae bacterium]|nr:hypothetical protein [Parachlamydiaceae bacterium]